MESNFSSMQKIQEELKQMDDSMETILRDNVLPIDKWRLLFHIQTYLYHFQYLFDLFNNENNNSSIQLKHKKSDLLFLIIINKEIIVMNNLVN